MFSMHDFGMGAVLLGIAYVIYYLYWQLAVGAKRRAMIREKGCLPPKKFPAKDPILGIDMTMDALRRIKARTLLESTQERIKQIKSNTFTLPNLGREIVFTIEPENLKTIQALDAAKWGLGTRRKTFFKPLLGVGIFTTDGPEWKHSREMLRPNFHRSQIDDIDTFEVHVQNLIQAIPRDGSTVHMQELFFRLTIDSATEFLFGESTHCLKPGTHTVSSSRFAEAFNRAQEDVREDSRWGMLRYLTPRGDFYKRIEFIHNFVDYYVDKGLARRPELLAQKPNSDNGRYIFIDELVRQTTDRVRIRDELLNILLAGRDTTASLLSNVWWVLSKRPDIWAALRKEVDSLNGARPSFEQLKELKYLKAVLNESLRLHPVVPLNSREAFEDTTIPVGGGADGRAPIFIKAGQVVAWNLYAMHRRKDYYGEDAEEFKPERWIGDKGLRPGWEYLPFNGGPRICIGQQFALTEASYTTVRLMQEFRDIETRDAEDKWRESMTLTCVGLDGPIVGLTPY